MPQPARAAASPSPSLGAVPWPMAVGRALQSRERKGAKGPWLVAAAKPNPVSHAAFPALHPLFGDGPDSRSRREQPCTGCPPGSGVRRG